MRARTIIAPAIALTLVAGVAIGTGKWQLPSGLPAATFFSGQPAAPPARGPATPAASATPPPYDPTTCGVVKAHTAMLSLDDYPYHYTKRFVTVPKMLKDNDLGMITFLLTKPFGSTAKATAQVDALRRAGLYVANHTYSHPDLTGTSSANIKTELIKGVKKSNRVREPGGATNARVRRVIKEYGAKSCLWNVDTRDWEKFKGADGKMHFRSTQSILKRIAAGLTAAKGRPVMILGHWHTNYPLALAQLNGSSRIAGYRFCHHFNGVTTATIPDQLYC